MICCQNENEINEFINGLMNKQISINSILQQTKRIDNNNPYIGSYNNRYIKVIIINQRNYSINPKLDSFQQQGQKPAYQGDGINTNVILQQMQGLSLNEQQNNYMGQNAQYVQNNYQQSNGFNHQAKQPTQINRQINNEIKCILNVLIDFRIIKKKIYSENRLRLMGFVMYEKLFYLPEYHTSFYTISKEEQKRFNFLKGDAEGLVNIPQQIKVLKLSISLREDTEKERVVWVSLRSVDDFPCNEMAEQFYNGGGHLNASGGRLNGTLDEAVEITRKAIEAYAAKLK